MALADPQSVTVAGTATSLPRTGLSLVEGAFLDSTGQLSLQVLHSTSRRTRHTIKLQKSEIVSDPLVPSTNQNVSYSAHIVIDLPKNGVSTTNAADLATALASWCTPTNLAKVIAGES